MKFQMLGDANHAGPVRLSDVYNSQVGDASTGIAASQKALYDAYSSLNSRLSSKLNTDILSNGEDNTGGNNGVLFTGNTSGSNFRGYMFTNNGIYFIMIDANGNASYNGFAKIYGSDVSYNSTSRNMRVRLGQSCRFKTLKISGSASYQIVNY